MITEGRCPDCGHGWGGHIGNTGGRPCGYRERLGGGQLGRACGCRREDPASIEEGRFAAGAWNAFMGRP